MHTYFYFLGNETMHRKFRFVVWFDLMFAVKHSSSYKVHLYCVRRREAWPEKSTLLQKKWTAELSFTSSSKPEFVEPARPRDTDQTVVDGGRL